jgi:hypothetical protein
VDEKFLKSLHNSSKNLGTRNAVFLNFRVEYVKCLSGMGAYFMMDGWMVGWVHGMPFCVGLADHMTTAESSVRPSRPCPMPKKMNL